MLYYAWERYTILLPRAKSHKNHACVSGDNSKSDMGLNTQVTDFPIASEIVPQVVG